MARLLILLLLSTVAMVVSGEEIIPAPRIDTLCLHQKGIFDCISAPGKWVDTEQREILAYNSLLIIDDVTYEHDGLQLKYIINDTAICKYNLNVVNCDTVYNTTMAIVCISGIICALIIYKLLRKFPISVSWKTLSSNSSASQRKGSSDCDKYSILVETPLPPAPPHFWH